MYTLNIYNVAKYLANGKGLNFVKEFFVSMPNFKQLLG